MNMEIAEAGSFAFHSINFYHRKHSSITEFCVLCGVAVMSCIFDKLRLDILQTHNSMIGRKSSSRSVFFPLLHRQTNNLLSSKVVRPAAIPLLGNRQLETR